jgi:hypothetical protein
MRITRSKALHLMDLPVEIFEHHIITALDYPHRYALSAVNRFFRGLLRGRLFRGRGKEYACPTSPDAYQKVFYTNGRWHVFGESAAVQSRAPQSLVWWNLSQSYARRFQCPNANHHLYGISAARKYFWLYDTVSRTLSIHDVHRNGRIVYTVTDIGSTPFRWLNNDRHFIMPSKRTSDDDVHLLMMHTVAPVHKTAVAVPPKACATYPPRFVHVQDLSGSSHRPWVRYEPLISDALIIIPGYSTSPGGCSIRGVATDHPLIRVLWAATYDRRYFLISQQDTTWLSVYDVSSKTVVTGYDITPSIDMTFVAASPVAYEFAVGTQTGVYVMVRSFPVMFVCIWAFGPFALRPPSAHLHRHLRTQRLEEDTTLTLSHTLFTFTACEQFKWHPTVAGLYAIRPYYEMKITVGYRDTMLGSIPWGGEGFKWAPDGSSLAVHGNGAVTIYE